MTNRITVVTVIGDGVEDTFTKHEHPDRVWEKCAIDGIWVDVRVKIRRWKTEGHPLTVYLDGSSPIYPTIVYRSGGALIAFDAGKIGFSS